MRFAVKWSAGALFGLAALVLTSGSALADAPAQGEIRVPTAATSECPKSVSERYPWLVCRTGAAGTPVIAGPTGNDSWENSRTLLGDHPFVNQGGFFGAIAER